jgi:hypothetical protein
VLTTNHQERLIKHLWGWILGDFGAFKKYPPVIKHGNGKLIPFTDDFP